MPIGKRGENMNKIKAFFNRFKLKKHNKKSKIKEIKPALIAESLTIAALIIIFLTTFILNKYIGMYVLAIILIVSSYFISINGLGGDG
jgi:uncharacterized membrane protein